MRRLLMNRKKLKDCSYNVQLLFKAMYPSLLDCFASEASTRESAKSPLDVNKIYRLGEFPFAHFRRVEIKEAGLYSDNQPLGVHDGIVYRCYDEAGKPVRHVLLDGARYFEAREIDTPRCVDFYVGKSYYNIPVAKYGMVPVAVREYFNLDGLLTGYHYDRCSDPLKALTGLFKSEELEYSTDHVHWGTEVPLGVVRLKQPRVFDYTPGRPGLVVYKIKGEYRVFKDGMIYAVTRSWNIGDVVVNRQGTPAMIADYLATGVLEPVKVIA